MLSLSAKIIRRHSTISTDLEIKTAKTKCKQSVLYMKRRTGRTVLQLAEEDEEELEDEEEEDEETS
ncbi:MAG: hypothetical protein ABSF09_03925 [Candidatus Bathyarchaeia archaeon]